MLGGKTYVFGATGTWTKLEPSGQTPSGRWLHSATGVDGNIYVFGGIVDDRKRFNDLHVYDPVATEWRKINTRGSAPAPRGHHTGTFFPSQNKLIIFGGYGGGGRTYNELDCYDISTLTWAPLPTKGTMPKARFDHSASLAGNKLVIVGGRNNDGPVDQINVLDITTLIWALLKEGAGERPVPLFAHAAIAVESAISWKLFTFGGRLAPFEYVKDVFCMDTSNMLWVKPKVNSKWLADGREHAAVVFDSKSARLLFIGGWQNRWHMDCSALQISGIVGPSYAVTSLEPVLGPLTGGRELKVRGLNFVSGGKVEVMFTNRVKSATVSGRVISETELICTTPSFEEHGAQEVEIKVAMNNEMFTVNRVWYRYYDDTQAGRSVAYGPGLVECVAGRPAKFKIQAKDTKNLRRTSGTDNFSVSVVCNDGRVFIGECCDHDTGSYTMTYICPFPGEIDLHIKLGNSHIRGSPRKVKAHDPWKDISPISGTPNLIADAVHECMGAPGNWIQFKESKTSENPVNIFIREKESWVSAKMDGKAPVRIEGESNTYLDEKLLMFGGWDIKKQTMTDEARVLHFDQNLSTWNWTVPAVTGTGPCARKNHSACNVNNKHIALSGGEGAGSTLDFHLLQFPKGQSSVVEWLHLKQSGKTPRGRFDHAMGAAGNRVFIFGGKLIVDMSLTREQWIAKFGNDDMFSFYDKDGSGVIDADEWLRGNAALVEEMRAKKAAEAEEAANKPPPKEEKEEDDEEEADAKKKAAEEEEAKKKSSEPKYDFLDDFHVAAVDPVKGTLQWETPETTGPKPCPRARSQIAWVDSNLLVYGGVDAKGKVLDDMYAFNPATMEWRLVYERPTVEADRPWRPFIDTKSKQLVILESEEVSWDVGHTLDLVPLLAKETLAADTNDVVMHMLKEVEEFMSTTNKAIDTKVSEGELDQLLRVMGSIADANNNADKFDLRMDELLEATLFLESEGVNVGPVSDRIEKVGTVWEGMKKKAPKKKTAIKPFQDKEGRRIKNNLTTFGENMEATREEFKNAPFFFWFLQNVVVPEGQIAPVLSPAAAYTSIKQWNKRISDAETELSKMTKLAELFECLDAVDSPKEFLGKCRDEIRLVKIMWDAAALAKSYYDAWEPLQWTEIETEMMEDVNKMLRQELRVMDKRIRQEIKGYEGLRDAVTDMGVVIPVIGDLRGDSMRIRHWDAIKAACKIDDKVLDSSKVNELTYKKLVDMRLQDCVELIGDIVDAAQKEAKIEKNLQTLAVTWANLEWEFTQHNTTDVYLVRVNEETFDTLEDNQVLVQNMAASRFVAEFEKEVGQWQRHLATVSEMVQIMSEIQRTWAYLEELFIGSEEVKRELPEDAERFVGIDRDVKETLAEFSAVPNLVEVCNKPGLYAKLENTQHMLEMCEKSLMDFMEAKRRAFPRFYFVSTKDLLDILSNGNRPEKVMEHIPKIFQAIDNLDLIDEKSANGDDIKTAKGMVSPQKEYVAWATPAQLVGKVEMWLHKTIDAMRLALKTVINEANTIYPATPRPQFIQEQAGQVGITSCQTFWCIETEKAIVDLNNGNAKAMEQYVDFQQVQIVDLIACVRTPLPSNARRNVMNIITLDSHAREMNRALVRDNVTEREAFGWQCQLKYRIDPDDKFTYINICDAEFMYAYEYLGNMPRLVITPLTDRIYVTATQALHLILGCAPAGPAGTGKTETTKDLASQAGVACYVFNCSDQMDYRSMGDIFKGLASSGCWGCFDEFNRISPEVLSVCSVQYKSVLDGIRKHTGYFNFPGEEELVLNYDVGAFITMNPGYLGRTELPEGLKALFRPVTVVVPDFELICENMLMAEGYEEAKILAHKFVVLYQLNRDLLSKQLHYDWGLRAIKSVLVVAGGFKRSEPEVPELALLMRALRDFNVPKIPAVDMPVFMGLISDLFPKMNIPPKRNMDLEKIAAGVLKQMQLQAQDVFVVKVTQLEELIQIRHCIFLLGTSGSGKSEVFKTLAKSWTKQGNKTMVKDINPKAITPDDFYGVISLATREWKDGLFSSMMRDLSRIPDTNPKWIILDGDLDTNWIESMNSVMDDNKLLTLASNERIPLLPHMRLIFELRDLVYASPATVSRAGVLYISDGEQYKWYITSWISKRVDDSQEQKDILTNLFEKYIDPSLDYIIKNLKALVPVLNFNMVQSLCHLLAGLLIPENISPDCTDKMAFEVYFCFAAVWAFGAAMAIKDGEDYRLKFNRWWRAEWRPIKYPDVGSVFDYYVDSSGPKFALWADITQEIEYNSDMPMASVTVPTQETTGLGFWLNNLLKARVPVLFVGFSGCGKTAVMKGTLKQLDAEERQFVTINFNYFTDVGDFQRVMEAPLEKKAGRNYGPKGQLKLIYFVDDLNMPRLDAYNTQKPISLMRQHFDYEHWYDLEKLQHKNIGNCQYVSCMNPAAGSFVIDPRLQRHYVTYAIGMPNQESLLTIFSTFIEGALKSFDPTVLERTTKLINAGLELHQKVAQTFRKTAIKFHYEFNVRHLTKMFGGVSVAKREQIKTPEKLVKLWIHECERTYGDLLMSPEDGVTYQRVAREIAKKYFPADKDDLIFPNPNIFCYFANGLTDKVYSDIPSFDKLSELLADALRDYNDNFAVMDLVLFEDATRHICRINRVIEAGHALLVGVGGSGKQSLSRLASFISGNTATMITIARGYALADFKLDIMNMYMKCGLKDERISFMMTDSQIIDEKFLVCVNDLLASGDIPDLFPPDEMENVLNGVRSEAKSNGIIDTNENLYEFFLSKVRANLHMILCFSPVGEAFRVRARRFPALVNNTVIDWFHPWPEEALQSVSLKFLDEVDLGSEAVKDAIIKFMPFSFGVVNKASDIFLRRQKRYNYTTPKSFLELIALYKSMLQSKRDSLTLKSDRLQGGLDKLQGTAKNVGELEEFLKVKAVEVEKAIASAELLSEKVGVEKAICGKEGAEAAVTKERCLKVQREVTQKQEDCERELAAALPAVAKAMAALDTINKKDLGELKSLKKPPAGIDDVTGAVLCLMAPKDTGVPKDRSWGAAVKMMKEIDKFMKDLFGFKELIDTEQVPAANFKAVRPYIKLEEFLPEKIVKKSGAAAGLCDWVINITIYYDIVSDVEPKKRLLAAAEQQLSDANIELAEVTEKVRMLNEKLAELEAEFTRVMKEKDDTVAESNRMAKKLEMAQRLIAALASENVRWTAGVGELTKQMELLPGDVLVAAGFVSYVGAFDSALRNLLMDDNFMPYITEKSIPRSEKADPVGLLTDEASIAGWNNNGLPADRVSTENGCLVTTCARWPLMIDPQMQGIVWIKTWQEKNNLLVTRLGVKGMQDRMERCIENGEPVLIENLGETIDAVLGPIVGRQFFRKNRKLNVKLGDKEVEVHKDFKLFLHTKLSNPHFPPEIQAETTLINFTVTELGLEEQLLAKVVAKERPDLEEKKAQLMQQQNQFKIKLKEIEDSLLYQLATAEGDLTENIVLIENLEESKRVATDINEKAEIAKSTEIEINLAREGYRVVATRSALLFFMLFSLVRVHSIYLYSLSSFVTVFERAIDNTTPEEDLSKRLQLLLDTITYSVWHYTRRGMFEKDKLIICTQLNILALKKESKIDLDELAFLLIGTPDTSAPEVPESLAAWMGEDVWQRICYLKQLPGLADLFADVTKSVKLWKAWMEDEKAEKVPLPPKLEGKTKFQKICIVRAMRPDRLTNALTDWCEDCLGARYVEEPSFNMMEVFHETSSANPTFFLLFPGVNPYNDVEMCGKELGYTEAKGNLRRISMGQGQEPIAESVIDEFSKTGGWVFLDNIHLMSTWLFALERKLEVCAEVAVKDFRCFLSAEPNPDPTAKNIPSSILESSIKIVNMPPSTLKANMRRSYAQFSQNTLNECDKKREMRGMIFALCFFHSALVARHKFGTQGWSRKYGYNFGDLTISGDVIRNYLNANKTVPWKDVKYIICEVMYGGHITDKWDRRVCSAYLEEAMKAEIFSGMPLAPGFPAPKCDEDYDYYKTYIEEAFPHENPSCFGLHNNAEIGFLLSSASALVNTILDISGGVGGGEGAGEDKLGGHIEQLLGELPPQYDMITMDQRAHERTPYQCVILQETERMNLLTGEIRRSLIELQLGLAGSLNMSDAMDALGKSMTLNRVPPNWNKVGYPSLKALAGWFQDLLRRCDQLKVWSDSLHTPVSVWISGLFNPMAYITAVLQTMARKDNLPLDAMEVWTDITPQYNPAAFDTYPEEGMYIHGMVMEGARWDTKKSVIADSNPKELHPAMPVIVVRGVLYDKIDKTGVFDCPVFITSERGGTFTFVATLKTNDPVNKWTLAGVAVMMSEDIAA